MKRHLSRVERAERHAADNLPLSARIEQFSLAMWRVKLQNAFIAGYACRQKVEANEARGSQKRAPGTIR